MKVVGFSGYSGSGKTTLVERLIPVLRLKGLRVSVGITPYSSSAADLGANGAFWTGAATLILFKWATA